MLFKDATQQKEFETFCATPATKALAFTPGRRMLKLFVTFAANIAIARAKAKDPNFDEAAARVEIDEAVKAIGDGQIWDWLVNGGLEKLIEWILLIIGMFG